MLLKYTQFQPFLDIEHSKANNTASLSNNNNSYDYNQIDRHQNNSSANSSSNETPIITSTSTSSAATTSTIIDKMYPYVTNHPSSHSGLSGMPGFSGLEDKTCR